MALDTAIIGGGPAGLAAARTLSAAGLRTAVFEAGAIGDHIARYPTFMQFFSTRENLEIAGFPMTIAAEKPTRQEYLIYLRRFAEYHRLDVRERTRVAGIEKRDGLFHLDLEHPGGRRESCAARTAIVAVGAFENPRRLGVPGDDLGKVRYRYTEPHEYAGAKVLVVGGRNSAVDTALVLWRAGSQVSLSYRRAAFDGHDVKYWLRPDIENRIRKGEIEAHMPTKVVRIEWDSVVLRFDDGTERAIANDFVLPMLGYDPPVGLLRRFGIETAPGSNIPLHDPETLETATPGLFVCGVITQGNISGKVFIENSRHHGEMMLARIRERAGAR